ncbi:MAG: DUF4197 family protein [Pseudomonadota bacterium]
MNGINRRAVLAGGAAGIAIITLPGCVTGLPTIDTTEVIRRLLLRASESAFARLIEPGGFWDRQVGQLGLDNLLGSRSDVLGTILTSSLVTDRLEAAFADIAVEGSYVAARVVREAVDTIGWENALALVRGAPDAATQDLRARIGTGLIDAIAPELTHAIRIANEPLVAQLVSSLTGADLGGMANELASAISDAVWTQIAREEVAIRADPQATQDPLLIAAFGIGPQL